MRGKERRVVSSGFGDGRDESRDGHSGVTATDADARTLTLGRGGAVLCSPSSIVEGSTYTYYARLSSSPRLFRRVTRRREARLSTRPSPRRPPPPLFVSRPAGNLNRHLPRSRASREPSPPRTRRPRRGTPPPTRARPFPRAASLRNVSTQMLSALCRIFASDVSAFATLRVPPHAFAHAFGSIVESSDATLARRSPPPLRRVEGDGVPRPRRVPSRRLHRLRRVHHVRQSVRAQDTGVQSR